MTEKSSPMTPPPELVQQWRHEWVYANPGLPPGLHHYIATAAAQWGADQELEACCEWLNKSHYGATLAANFVIEKLRAARRPKPPSLKEQALAALERRKYIMDEEDLDLLRRALEQLND